MSKDLAEIDSLLSEVEIQVIEVFVQLVRLVGLPKSIGEIYGLLYMSSEPMTMDQIIKRLGISLGSASQGLKQLKSFKAVKAVYTPGERKEHYIAELELRKLVAGFMHEEILPYMESANGRLENLQEVVDVSDSSNKEFEAQRLEHIARWHNKGKSFMKNAAKIAGLFGK